MRSDTMTDLRRQREKSMGDVLLMLLELSHQVLRHSFGLYLRDGHLQSAGITSSANFVDQFSEFTHIHLTGLAIKWDYDG